MRGRGRREKASAVNDSIVACQPWCCPWWPAWCRPATPAASSAATCRVMDVV